MTEELGSSARVEAAHDAYDLGEQCPRLGQRRPVLAQRVTDLGEPAAVFVQGGRLPGQLALDPVASRDLAFLLGTRARFGWPSHPRAYVPVAGVSFTHPHGAWAWAGSLGER